MSKISKSPDRNTFQQEGYIKRCEKKGEEPNPAYLEMYKMQFQKLDVMPILKDQRWSCSWRHAGGVVADMQEKGDYIDWYCSGIGNFDNGYGLDGTVPKLDDDGRTYVSESHVTDEIKEDLKKLGWVPVEWEED